MSKFSSIAFGAAVATAAMTMGGAIMSVAIAAVAHFVEWTPFHDFPWPEARVGMAIGLSVGIFNCITVTGADRRRR